MLVVCLLSAIVAADLPAPDHTGRAKAFVELLNKGDFAKAVEPFDAKMIAAMPADKLKKNWEMLTKQVGPFKEATGTRTETRGKYELIFVGVQFEKAKWEVRVVFD